MVAEKTSSMEQETFKTRRLQEELAALRRKLERAKKIELAGAADDVLMEEVSSARGTQVYGLGAEQIVWPSASLAYLFSFSP